GLLPVVLDEAQVDELFKQVEAAPGYALTIDLEKQQVTTPDGARYAFEVDAFKKHCLLNGLDEIGLTLEHADDIRAYEDRRRQETPWLFSR
ncbi:MAG: 3-isopropylmalate dehydratase small subunit, partial [Gammaproteobacteria bacterium]|nr:3-isopropylmalate dehydratase small subunit [Gammaproteobacteria bacterium]